jgi:hypothetical protein
MRPGVLFVYEIRQNVKPEISKPMTVSLLSRNYTVDAYYTLKPGLYKDLNLVT